MCSRLMWAICPHSVKAIPTLHHCDLVWYSAPLLLALDLHMYCKIWFLLLRILNLVCDALIQYMPKHCPCAYLASMSLDSQVSPHQRSPLHQSTWQVTANLLHSSLCRIKMLPPILPRGVFMTSSYGVSGKWVVKRCQVLYLFTKGAHVPHCKESTPSKLFFAPIQYVEQVHELLIQVLEALHAIFIVVWSLCWLSFPSTFSFNSNCVLCCISIYGKDTVIYFLAILNLW